MPLTSIQLYTKGLLDGLAVPGTTATLEAFVTPPTVDTLDRPKAFVQGARMRASRQTAPRGPGFKHLAWMVDVFLSYETNPDSATVDTEFPGIIDAVMTHLWTVTTPTFIDSNGVPFTLAFGSTAPAGSSQILNMGEEMELEYPPERVPATLRMLYYTARLGIDLYEAVQA